MSKETASERAEKELARIAEKHDGTITPEQVVAVAKNPKNPMHAYFDWDLRSAAHKYRLEQARELIRHVKVVTVINEISHRSVGYVRDTRRKPDEAGYVHIARVISDEELAHETIAHEFAMAAASIRRARSVAKVLGQDKERRLDKVLEEVVHFPADLRRVPPEQPDA